MGNTIFILMENEDYQGAALVGVWTDRDWARNAAYHIAKSRPSDIEVTVHRVLVTDIQDDGEVIARFRGHEQ